MNKLKPVFRFEMCISCGICVQDCPVSCIALAQEGIDKLNNLYPMLVEDTCISCAICAKNCPMDCIEMK